MGAFIDLTGQKFGRLTVIGDTSERKRGCAIWLCKCECGVFKNKKSYDLLQKKTTSCGKGRCRTNFIDLTGNRIGKWTVGDLQPEKRGRSFVWLCKCDCGTIRKVSGEMLRRGVSESCGKLSCHSKFIDVSGKKFGKLTVIKILSSRIDGNIAWECICDCGIVVRTKRENMKSNSSCGERKCRSSYNDLTGIVFSKLTAIRYTHTIINDYWDFKCSCGKTINILSLNVTKGHTKSCGCLKRKKEHLSIQRSAFRHHVTGAKRRGIENNLTIEEYLSIASQRCHYCGAMDTRINKQTNATIKLNGVDRKNNEKFYKMENSLSCCRKHNTMKMDLTFNEFIRSIRMVAEYTKNVSLDRVDNKESAQ